MYMYNYSYNIIIIDLLDQIAADLRSVVPPTAIAPDEAQHYPTVGQVHVGKRESQLVCVYTNVLNSGINIYLLAPASKVHMYESHPLVPLQVGKSLLCICG